MFKGIYHGNQCHAADIPAVLARAWAAGVDRIIVMPPGRRSFRSLLLNCLGFLAISCALVWCDGRSPEGL